jgi:hypothetical protein
VLQTDSFDILAVMALASRQHNNNLLGTGLIQEQKRLEFSMSRFTSFSSAKAENLLTSAQLNVQILVGDQHPKILH